MTDDELRLNFESLHANPSQLYEIVTRQGERQRENDRQIGQLTQLLALDADNIRALTRIEGQ